MTALPQFMKVTPTSSAAYKVVRVRARPSRVVPKGALDSAAAVAGAVATINEQTGPQRGRVGWS